MKKRAELFCVNNLIWIINIALYIIFVCAESKLLLPKNIISMVYSATLLGMLIYAQAIVLISGNFDMSVGAIAGFSATFVAVLNGQWLPGLPWFLLVVIALLIGIGVGFYNGLLIAKLKINPFLQTLGSYVLFYGLMLIIGRKTLYTLPEDYFLAGGGFVGDTGIPIAVIVLVGATALMYFLLNKTTLGRQIYAVGSNSVAAETCGISVPKTLIKVYVLSGAFSAVAGLLYTGYMNCVTMDLAKSDLFMTFAGAILGGVAIAGGSGKVSGIFGGILFLGILSIGLTMLDSPATWREGITGIILTLSVIMNTYQTKLKARILSRDSLKRAEAILKK